jgi:hypothetical protein
MTLNLALRLGATAPASSWSPTDLGSQLALWLDADDASSFTFSSGSEVSQWNDKSGNSRHWTQSTVGNQPTRTSSAINGRAAVDFVAANSDYLLNSSQFAGSFTASELYIVMDLVAEVDQGIWNIGGGGETQWYTFSGDIYENFGSTARKNTGNPSATLTTPHIYNVRSASGVFSTHINGTQHYTTATNSVGWLADTYWLARNASNFYMNGYIAEVIWTNATLSAGDRTSTFDYLKNKWGTP